jgi:signal transduction histidine kinase
MRSRTTLLLVVLVLIFVSAVYVVRTVSVQRHLREHDQRLLHSGASAIALAVDERIRAGRTVDAAFLRDLVADETAVRFHPGSGGDVSVDGSGFAGSGHPGDDGVSASAPTIDHGYVVLSEDGDAVRDAAGRGGPAMVLLLLLTGLLAALAGALLGRWYVRPFRPLAEAAAALGRGRFQLDLPRSRVPEANAIAEALDASARQLQERLAGEDAFAQRASHALRTPLTGLRLELEDAALREGLSDDAAAALARSLRRVDQLDAVTGELVAAARRGALVARATIPLAELAAQITQHWSDELEARHRVLTAVVEGDAATTYTPGPVEQILEFVLVDVVHRTGGDVGIVLAVTDDLHLRITVTAGAVVGPRRTTPTAPLVRARAVAVTLGGLLQGEYAVGGVEIVLPRR